MKRPHSLQLFLWLCLLLPFSLLAQDPPGAKRFTNQMVHGGSVRSVCYSPDGKYALSGGSDVKLWDVGTGREIRILKGHSSYVSSVCFSPDGRYALSGSNDNTIKLWEVSTGREVRTLKGHTKRIRSVCFSPDGRYALSGSADNTTKLWEVSTGQTIRTLTGETKLDVDDGFVSVDEDSYVSSVCFSPDGRYALSASYETLQLWEVSTGREIRTLKVHSYVSSVCFSPDGRYVLSESYKTLKLWEVSTGREIRTLTGHTDLVSAVCFSPDGRYALSASYKTLKLWEVSTGQTVRTTEYSSYVSSVCFSPDGRYALIGSYDETLKLWEMSTGQIVHTLSGHSSGASSVCFSPDGRYALSGSEDKTLKLWEVSTGREIRTLTGHTDHVSSVCFSPDGRYALSGSKDETLKIWEVSTGQTIRTRRGLDGYDYVISVCFSPDGRYALSGSKDETLKIWKVSTGRKVRTLQGKQNFIYGYPSLDFSPDGRYALSGSFDETIKVWEVTTGRRIRTLKGHSEDVRSVCFSPDGRYALSGSDDKTLKLWDVSTGETIHTLTGHSGGVSSVCFSSDGHYALSGSWDKTIRLWEVETGKELKSWPINYSVEKVAFSPDGSAALVGTAAYFVSFSLEGIIPGQKPLLQTTVSPTSVFSQIIWPSSTTTVHEPVYTARAVLVSNYPNPIQAEQIRVYVNGQRQASGQKMGIVTLKANQGRYNYEQTLPLLDGKNEIVLGLLLPNQPEVRSEPLTITYLPPTRPNLYVLTIGVAGQGLDYAPADAEQVGQLLARQQGKLFNQVKIAYLNGRGKATVTQLRNEMGILPSMGITPNDVLLLFVSAHGKKLNLRNGQSDFAILPEDYDERNLNTEENTTLLYKGHILENIESLNCKKLILFDACHSGEAVLKQGGKAQFLADLRQAQAIIKQTPAGLITVASSSEGQLSWEDPAWQHGAFTKVLLDGLAGAADLTDTKTGRKDGYVWVSELFQHLQKNVPTLVQAKKKEAQQPQMYPTTLSEGQDFPLVKY